MKLIWEPKAHLISSPTIDDEKVWQFLADNGVPPWVSDTEVSAQELVEIAGRTCYMSFENPRPGGNAKYISHILSVGHGSVLEHANFSFIIDGISRSLSHELVRHRAGFAYSQLSQRYVDESEVAFVVPPVLLDEIRAGFELWDKPIEGCWTEGERRAIRWLSGRWSDLQEYKELSDYLFTKYADIADKTARRKAAREAARSVLPNATETKIVATANARAWRHFVEMRASAAADAEIDRLAILVLRKLQQAAPNIFGDYVIEQVDGREVASTSYRKV